MICPDSDLTRSLFSISQLPRAGVRSGRHEHSSRRQLCLKCHGLSSLFPVHFSQSRGLFFILFLFLLFSRPGAGLQWPLHPDWQKCVVSAEALDAHFDSLSRALSQRKGPGRSKLLERAHRAYASALVEELEIAVEFYGKTEKKLQAIHCRARAGKSFEC